MRWVNVPKHENGPCAALTSRGGNKREALCNTCPNLKPLINDLVKTAKTFKSKILWMLDYPSALTAQHAFIRAVDLSYSFDICLCMFMCLSLPFLVFWQRWEVGSTLL